MLKLTKKQLLDRLERGFTDSIFYPEVVLRAKPFGGQVILSARLDHKQFPHDFAKVSELKTMPKERRFELLVNKVMKSPNVFRDGRWFYVLSDSEMEFRTLAGIDMDDVFSGEISVDEFNREYGIWEDQQ